MAKVLYERHGRIARITLNRPAVLNAIDDDLPRELAAAVERADADDAVHVIVLAGAGRAFVPGEGLEAGRRGARSGHLRLDHLRAHQDEPLSVLSGNRQEPLLHRDPTCYSTKC